MKFFTTLTMTCVFAALTLTLPLGADQPMRAVDKADVEKHLVGWKAKPKEAAMMLMNKYGPPHEVTAHRVIWHDNGPWKMTAIINEEIPHDFPMPHVDFMYQAVAHKIEAEHADEITEFDGSAYVDRTRGLLAARCDKEEPNFLAVNMAHEIMMGKRKVEDARKFYAESMMAFMKTKKPNEYQTKFLFEVPAGNQGDKDTPHEK